MKPRQCPHCGVCANADRGYYFDKDLNLICGQCNKVMYPTRSSDEHNINKRDTWRKSHWEKDDEKRAPSPHKRVPKKNAPVVYSRPASANRVVGFVPEKELFIEPVDNLRREAEIESGL